MLPRWHPQYWLLHYPSIQESLDLLGFLFLALPLWTAACFLHLIRDLVRFVRNCLAIKSQQSYRSQVLFEQPAQTSPLSEDAKNGGRGERATQTSVAASPVDVDSVIREPTHVFITGASSGIGESLAKEYARPGVTLTLVGRNAGVFVFCAKLCTGSFISVDRMRRIQELCEARGAQVTSLLVDVTDVQRFERMLLQVDARIPIDLVLVNAGVNGRQVIGAKADDDMDEDDFVAVMKPIIQVNYIGAIASFQPLLKRFMQRRRGQIALVSSGLGIAGIPTSPTYSSSKAGLVMLAETMRPVLSRYNVRMNVICPGYVETKMTDSLKVQRPWFVPKFIPLNWMPLAMMSADRAASIIREGLILDAPLIAFPFHQILMVKLISHLPIALRMQIAIWLWKRGVLYHSEVGDF